MFTDPTVPRPCIHTRIALLVVLLAGLALGGFGAGHAGRDAASTPAHAITP